jgi:hypothetical protein
MPILGSEVREAGCLRRPACSLKTERDGGRRVQGRRRSDRRGPPAGEGAVRCPRCAKAGALRTGSAPRAGRWRGQAGRVSGRRQARHPALHRHHLARRLQGRLRPELLPSAASGRASRLAGRHPPGHRLAPAHRRHDQAPASFEQTAKDGKQIEVWRLKTNRMPRYTFLSSRRTVPCFVSRTGNSSGGVTGMRGQGQSGSVNQAYPKSARNRHGCLA